MLVGRDLLLEAGDGALRSALAGRGRLVLLTGEAGIGKTTLAAALADRARDVGALVRTGACWETDRLPPFTPWLDVLHRPGDDPCASAAARLEGADRHEARDASDAVRARGRRFADVVDALRACGTERPQVVVLEDLHWADHESLELLVAVAAHLPTMRVLVIGTYRDDELPAVSGLASVGGNADRLALVGLDRDAVTTVLSEVLGRAATADEGASVLRQTAGNPLFVTQVGRLLGSGASTVPTGVREVLDRRFARTSTACDRIMGAAAVLGSELDQAALEAMLGEPVGDALDEAAAARLVVADEDRPGRWRFVHELVRAARYDRLSTRERADLHGAAVHALRSRPTVSPSTLAHHAARGGFEPSDPLPAALFVDAGGEALDRFAWADAEAAFLRAVELVPTTLDGDDVLAEAWLGIGASRLRQGRDDARDAFDRAAELGRRAGRPELLGRAALGFGVGLGAFEVRMLDHHQIELLEEAAATLGPTDALLPLVLARLSVALAFVDPSDRRVELAERAVELARASGDAVALGNALAAWCDARAGLEHVDDRLEASSEAISLGRRSGDLPLELLGRRLRLVALLERCDHTGAEGEVSAYAQAAAALGDPLYTWFGALWRSALAAAHGRRTEADELLEEAAGLGALGGSSNSALLRGVADLMTAVDARDRARADAAFATMVSVAPDLVSAYASITTAYTEVALGDLDRARDLLRAVTVADLDALPLDSEWVCTMVQLAYAASRAGDAVLVRYVRDRLAPLADLAAVEGIGAYLHGSIHRFLGLLAAAEGDRDATRDHVQAARVAARGGGAVLQALTDLDGAWSLARSEDPDDRAAAVDLARQAATAFAAAGLTAVAAEAHALAAVDGAGPTKPDVGEGSSATSEGALLRAGDAWDCTWEGRTVHVRHAKGIADLATLIEHQGREVHVRQLEGIADLVPSGVPSDVALDQTAVEHYRRRLVELEDDLDEADRNADAGRAERLAAERDALVAELTKAFGLGGRARRAGNDPDERLRKAVSARVRASVDRLEALHPSLGRHLRASVRTGFWCCYEPERQTRWSVRRH